MWRKKKEKNGGRRNSCLIFNTQSAARSYQAETKFIKSQLKGSSHLDLLYFLYFKRLGVNIQMNGEGKKLGEQNCLAAGGACKATLSSGLLQA